jgi:hypothetical protein
LSKLVLLVCPSFTIFIVITGLVVDAFGSGCCCWDKGTSGIKC